MGTGEADAAALERVPRIDCFAIYFDGSDLGDGDDDAPVSGIRIRKGDELAATAAKCPGSAIKGNEPMNADGKVIFDDDEFAWERFAFINVEMIADADFSTPGIAEDHSFKGDERFDADGFSGMSDESIAGGAMTADDQLYGLGCGDSPALFAGAGFLWSGGCRGATIFSCGSMRDVFFHDAIPFFGSL